MMGRAPLPDAARRRGRPEGRADRHRRGSRAQSAGPGQRRRQPQATGELVRVLDQAERDATKAGDEYVAQDRLLLTLAASDTPAARVLRQAGATPQALDKAVADIRKGRKVTSANAEESFDALKKYARDVTATAAKASVDPVIGVTRRSAAPSRCSPAARRTTPC